MNGREGMARPVPAPRSSLGCLGLLALGCQGCFSLDGRFACGMLSPYAEAGVFLSPFVVSAFAEYDLRFTSQRNEGFIGIMAGPGFGVSTQSPRDFGEQLVH